MNQVNQALVFSVAGSRYAMDILHLKEVGRIAVMETVADGPVHLLGMTRMHGRPVQVYDLDALLNGASRKLQPGDSERSWIIVSHSESGDIHWRVTAVEDIVDYDPEQIIADREGNAPDILYLADGLTHVLTPDLLCRRQQAA